jgi:putative hydrolase of the HAD superfamily
MAFEARDKGGGGSPLEGLPARPKAVLIDALGTLVALEPPHAHLRATLYREAGVDVSAARAAQAFRAEIRYYLAQHLEGRDPESLADLRDRCAAVLHEALGEPQIDPALVRRAMLESIHFDAFADAAAALRALRAGGLRIVVASNWDCSLPDVLADAHLLHLVDAVVPSAVAGAAKPDPGLFEAALAAARCPAAEAIHVGDSVEKDVAGAVVAGVAPILLVRDPSAPGVAPPGTPVIRSLAELPAVLGAGGRMLGGG